MYNKENILENTSEFIIETIAPIFNKKGYVGTTLSDLTKATQLTKGALYCNFKNKEELALESFRYNAKKALHPLFISLSQQSTSVEKLKALTDYYRVFYRSVIERGGCPILNIGVDAKHNSPTLFNKAQNEATKLILGLSEIIDHGVKNEEFKEDIEASKFARTFYSMIEGAVFMAMMYEDNKYLIDAMDLMDSVVETQLKRI